MIAGTPSADYGRVAGRLLNRASGSHMPQFWAFGVCRRSAVVGAWPGILERAATIEVGAGHVPRGAGRGINAWW